MFSKLFSLTRKLWNVWSRRVCGRSLTVEDFSLERLKRLERPQIEERLLAFAEMVRLED